MSFFGVATRTFPTQLVLLLSVNFAFLAAVCSYLACSLCRNIDTLHRRASPNNRSYRLRTGFASEVAEDSESAGLEGGWLATGDDSDREATGSAPLLTTLRHVEPEARRRPVEDHEDSEAKGRAPLLYALRQVGRSDDPRHARLPSPARLSAPSVHGTQLFAPEA